MSVNRCVDVLAAFHRGLMPSASASARRKLGVVAVFMTALAIASGDARAQGSANPAPQRLRDTGLYAGSSTADVAPGILAFSPQYPLWSDGAKKRRWISLPPGTFIDASRADAWAFPRGTRLWKEFSVGRRVETRFIERLQDGSWRYATYVWNEAGTDAVLASADGVASLPLPLPGGRRYTIPSEPDCRACHEGAAAPVLGFSALQLSPDRDPQAPHAEPSTGVDLRSLVARDWLRNLPPALLKDPPRIAAANATERAALGYLHGNCGHCHGKPDDAGASAPVGILLAQSVAEPNSAAVLQSLLGASSRFRPAGAQHAAQLVVPGVSSASVLPMRMRSRDPRVQMPPLGTDTPDSEALALIERWIDRSLQR
jgi:hypothetical protein